jgi:hypothetical protein
MNNIQQDIQLLINSHKSTTRWVIAVLIVVVLLLLFRLFYGHTDPIIIRDDQRVHNSLDSLHIWTQQWQQSHDRDSISAVQYISHLNRIEVQVNRVPAMIQSINNRTNAQIHTITLLSNDQQLTLLSEWLSSSDSL